VAYATNQRDAAKNLAFRRLSDPAPHFESLLFSPHPEALMRFLAPLTLALFLLGCPTLAQKNRAHDPHILNAKTVYFFNRTGSLAVGTEALAALKKWNKYKLVTDRNQADLIFLLDCDPYLGGNIIYSGGQTGSIDHAGNVTEDPVPNYTKARPTQYAYLYVIDTTNGKALWSADHPWGGLLTGYNSVGARLIHKLQKQTSH
jgi:hypothetical protein